jgi:hypothetical protein
MNGTQTDRPVLGAKFQPAPGVLVLTASRLREFELCKRRYFLARVLNLRSDSGFDAVLDTTGELPRSSVDRGGASASSIGLYVHEELHVRHQTPALHHSPEMARSDQPPIPAVMRAVMTHLDLCPGQEGARYIDGEVDLRWFLAGKAALINGRIDALWQHEDGTVEVRDYKTGTPTNDLSDDTGALIYALLVAAHHPRVPVRITYEYLGNEPEQQSERLLTLEVTSDDLQRGRSRIESAINRIRTEQDFPPSPSDSVCRWCPFRARCDAAAPNSSHVPGSHNQVPT